MEKYDVIIIGAGAAGLMCAIEAGKRKRKVIVLDHSNKPGKKILMSGGGRCNFTNYYVTPDNFISHNPHFCKSALSRFTQWDFIELVNKYHIPFHEKTKGQLFCSNKSKDILDMLLAECATVNAVVRLNTKIETIEKLPGTHFKIESTRGNFHCQSVVIASGGLSIPTMGASPFGYHVAKQFGIKVWPTRAGLVPITLHPEDKDKLSPLSGISVESFVQTTRQQFEDNILFTHRGLSGPAILQISSYWQAGEKILINMVPNISVLEVLKLAQNNQPQKIVKNILTELLPKRVIETFVENETALKKIGSLSFQEMELIADQLNHWTLAPNATEGYRTAEVTLGGVDCDALSSKTMEVTKIPGLYFIGEVLDIAGWLGGYNFQWAWSSGWVAGQVV